MDSGSGVSSAINCPVKSSLDVPVDLDSTSPPTLVEAELRRSTSSLLDVTGCGGSENLFPSTDDVTSFSSSPSISLVEQKNKSENEGVECGGLSVSADFKDGLSACTDISDDQRASPPYELPSVVSMDDVLLTLRERGYLNSDQSS